MADREVVIADLRKVGQLAVDLGEEKGRLGLELGVVMLGLTRLANAERRGDQLGQLQDVRMVMEAGIRVCWVAGNDEVGPERVDDAGYPVVDAERALWRLQGLRRRDLWQVVKAYEAVQGDDAQPEVIGKLIAMRDAIEAPMAPQTIRDLARSSSGSAMYAWHRLCSGFIHGGASGVVHLRMNGVEDPGDKANWAGAMASVSARGTVKAWGAVLPPFMQE